MGLLQLESEPHCNTLCDLSSNLVGYRGVVLEKRGALPKSEFLQIRLSPADRERIQRAAEQDHLDASTWARRVLLKELDSLDRASR